MRICQLLAYPDEYLIKYHEDHPEAASLTFKEQVQRLASAIPDARQYWLEDLNELGHEVRIIVATDRTSQIRWAAEKLGGAFEITAAWMHDLVIQQLRKIKPDLLLIMAPEKFGEPFISKIRNRVTTIAGWTDSSFSEGSIFSGYDLIISPSAKVTQAARNLGAARALHLPSGFPRAIAEAVFQTSRKIDVICLGPMTDHATAPVLQKLADLNKRSGKSIQLEIGMDSECHISIPNGLTQACSGIAGLSYYHKIASARLAVTLPLDSGRFPYQILEATGIGTATLVYSADLVRLTPPFLEGAQVLTYSSSDDLPAMIEELLSEAGQKKRVTLAAAAQEHCLTHHNNIQSMRRLMEALTERPAGFLGNFVPKK